MTASQTTDKDPTETKAGRDEKFTHLHLHTTYSLLDGAVKIPELMSHCKENGMDSVAITDHGNMFGAIDFYKNAVKHNIKPIIGCEFYVSPGKRTESRNIENMIDGNNYHLILLAQNEVGYKNIIKLTSRSFTEGFYRKPRIDYEILSEHSDGLICLSACLAGEIQRYHIDGQSDKAEKLASMLNEMFDKERFFLEIQNHTLPQEEKVAKANVALSRKLGIPLVLTNDSHFLRREDQSVQDILLRINQKKTEKDPLYFGFNSEFYVKSPKEMHSIFPDVPQAFYNTQEIADMVDLSFKFGNPLLPRFDVPENETLDSYMHKLAYDGLVKRYGSNPEKAITDRFEFEYDVIVRMDFSGYFLIVQDFINYAKRTGIPVGPGRGSAAGSIIAYSLGITDIDPLKYNLLFERFLNPDRKEMPDIDVDFCTERREEVINYVREKYGTNRVGQIITYGAMAAKACLKDVARVLEIPYEEANRISKMFPPELNINIEQALEKSPELKKYSLQGETQKKLFNVALALEGNIRQTGVHAAGVVIAPRPLEELVPLATVSAKNTGKHDGDTENLEEGNSTLKSSNERILVTQYDMNTCAEVGLVKMDFLGLRNLTIIDQTLKSIQKQSGKLIDILSIPVDDQKTYRMLQKGDVSGVFQLESSGMREFVIRTKPTRFEDLIALIALYRPGPLSSGMAESFINRKNGKEKITYPHADLKEVLQDTYGVIVYQEQVMLISRVIGGFTPGEADALRKAMGKKIKEKMNEMKIKFMKGAEEKKYNIKFAEEIYDQMAKFAEYGFNKSHSAAYALIVYQTAYLKANYPTDYMCAVLDSQIDNTERMIPYITSCHDMKINIQGPDVNQSGRTFTVVDKDTIRFGLSAIKNVGSLATDSIIETREKQGNFTSFLNVLERIDLRLNNKRTLESLIHSGAFDSLGYKRKALAESLDMMIQHATKSQMDRQMGQSSLFGFGESTAPSSLEDPVPSGENVKEFTEEEKLKSEKQLLGYYVSGHPMARFERHIAAAKIKNVKDLIASENGTKIEIAGILTSIEFKTTKSANRQMATVTIEDRSGTVGGIIFPAILEKLKENLKPELPLLISGTVEHKEGSATVQFRIDSLKELGAQVLDEKLEKSFHIMLKPNELTPTTVQELMTIMNGFRGELQVYFHINYDKQNSNAYDMLTPDENRTGDDRVRKWVMRAHDSFRVNVEKDLLERLSHIRQIDGLYLTVGKRIRNLLESGKVKQ